MFLGGIFDIVILVPILLYRGEGLFDRSLADVRTGGLIFAAMLVALVANFLILQSIKTLGASTAAILEISYPMFTALILFFFFGERLDSRFILGALLVMTGSYFIVSNGEKESSPTASISLEIEILGRTTVQAEEESYHPALSEGMTENVFL